MAVLMKTCVSLLTVLTLVFEGTVAVSTPFTSNTDCSSASCPVDPLVITCAHSNSGSGVTLWRATQMGTLLCQATAVHSGTLPVNCDDGPDAVFTVDDISNLTTSPDCLSSTANITDPARFEGLMVECLDSGGLSANLIGSCTVSFFPPPAAPPGLSLSVADITETTVTPPPRTWNITLRWEAPASEAGIANYTVTSAQHGAMDTTNTELTVPVDENMTYIFTVVATDMCGQTSVPSVSLNVRITVPSAPDSLTASMLFDRSNSSFTLSLEWPSVDTPDIAVTGSGEVLIDGRIRNYQITLPNNENVSVSVPVPCNTTTCSIVLDGQLDVNATEILVSITPVNAIGVGGSLQRVCNEFQVTPTESSPTDVTLTCATQSCAITYYRASSPDTVLTGTSGVPLQGLTEALYFYEVNFQCGGFDITVTDNFGICECLLSALFGGAGVEEAVCPQAGFARAVRAAGGSTGGAVCFDSTTNSSEAVYVCESDRDPCTGDCGAKCSCSPGQTVGQWNRTFSPQELCPLTSRGLTTGAIVGIIIGALIGLLLLAAIVALVVWLFCCRPDSGTPKKSKRNKKLTDEEHELREPSPITHDPNALYSNPTDIRHEAAPESHDQYAVLDTHTKKKPKTAPKAQESSELQKQVGPEGDVYTVPVPKRGSSKRKQESPPPSEEQLAEMYATPDMTQKGRNKNTAAPLFYADIGVSGPSRPAPVPTAGQVTYSTIAGTEPGPVEDVIEPTYAN